MREERERERERSGRGGGATISVLNFGGHAAFEV